MYIIIFMEILKLLARKKLIMHLDTSGNFELNGKKRNKRAILSRHILCLSLKGQPFNTTLVPFYHINEYGTQFWSMLHYAAEKYVLIYPNGNLWHYNYFQIHSVKKI